MNNKLVLLIGFFSFLAIVMYPQQVKAVNPVHQETMVYSVKGNDTLRLDKYSIKGDQMTPCVIFMFGGGFHAGTRNDTIYAAYFDFLVHKGFSVISIDYRLGLKNVKVPKPTRMFPSGRYVSSSWATSVPNISSTNTIKINIHTIST